MKAEQKATAVAGGGGAVDRDADVSGIQAQGASSMLPPTGDANAKHKGKAGKRGDAPAGKGERGGMAAPKSKLLLGKSGDTCRHGTPAARGEPWLWSPNPTCLTPPVFVVSAHDRFWLINSLPNVTDLILALSGIS